MSIRWDPLLVRHLASELDQTLSGARLRAIRLDGNARDLVLLFRERSLVWRLHPNRGFPLLLDAATPGERDQRLKARLRRIHAPSDERILILELTGEGRGGSATEVIVELMGNQLNAIVTEGPERTIRHVLRRREGRRPARVGHGYVMPSSTGRQGVGGDLSLDAWLAILEPVPPPDRERELVRKVAWASPLNAQTLLGVSTGATDVEPAEGTDPDKELRVGHERWRGMAAADASPNPVLLSERKAAESVQPYPFPLVGHASTPVPSILEGFERCSALLEEGGDAVPSLELSPELLERIEDAIAHHERRLVRLQGELDGRENPAELRSHGDLILSRYNEIASSPQVHQEVGKGASTRRGVTLRDFSGADVTLEIDITLPPHENAARYYDRAARSERAAERLPGLIEKASSDHDRLRALLERATSGQAEAQELRAALPARQVKRGRGNEAPAPPFRSYRSSGGIEIRVGRGSRHNDDLTFRHSSPNDVWLHARHTAGAHVILRWSGSGNPPARDLEEAGVLAALHSKARTSGSVPVDWTLRKYVRKPRGAAPGSVVPDRVKTIFVQPDETLLESLAVED